MATYTIGSGKDYTNLSTWEAYLDGIVMDAVETGNCYGDVSGTGTVYWDAIDTNSKVIIQAAEGEWAWKDGTAEKSGAWTDQLQYFLETDACDIEVHGIEFCDGDSLQCSLASNDSTFTVTRCIIRDNGDRGIYIVSCGDVEINIGVCLFRSNSSVGLQINDTDIITKCQLINCTFYDCQYGVSEYNGVFSAIKNVVCCDYDVNSSFIDYTNSPSNITYSAGSGDTTVGAGTGCIDTVSNDGTDFTDAANDDLTIKDTGAVFYHAGTPISGESWFPSVDLAGNAWDASNPSMGCFEYVSAAGGLSIPIAMSNYLRQMGA